MRNLKSLLFYVLINTCFVTAYAQKSTQTEAIDKTVKATNFSVPSSAAFNLLEINPSQVHRPGFARDFKFDWLLKDNKIVSNIAVEAQPLWLFFYKNKDYQSFIKQNVFERALSSLALSIGTSAKDSIRSLAWGAKINLYAKKNPIYDTAYINRIGNFFTNSDLENQVFAKQFECDNLNLTVAQKKQCLRELDSLKKEYDKELDAHFKSIDSYKEQYEKENWNTTIVDLGFGKLYSFLSESIDSLSFNNQGKGVWISGNFGVGKRVLINSMIKYAEIGGNKMTTMGANFRYGGLNTNFFVEGLYNTSALDNLKRITIAYGGDVRFKTFALQFGLRTDYNKDFKFRNLIPVVNFNYLIAQ